MAESRSERNDRLDAALVEYVEDTYDGAPLHDWEAIPDWVRSTSGGAYNTQWLNTLLDAGYRAWNRVRFDMVNGMHRYPWTGPAGGSSQTSHQRADAVPPEKRIEVRDHTFSTLNGVLERARLISAWCGEGLGQNEQVTMALERQLLHEMVDEVFR